MLNILYSAASYVVIVFPLALVWHVGFFKDKYDGFGYFVGEPNIIVGLITIVVQAIALALIYPLFHTGSVGFIRAFQFAGLMGLFFWTSHVLAFIAKQNVPDVVAFTVMETGYLVVQFGLFALALGLIYRSVD